MTTPSQRFLFVVGFARSGTSLLYNFLNLHPEIKLLYEADLLSQSLVSMSLLARKNWWDRLDFFNSACRRHQLTPAPSWKEVRTVRDAAAMLYRDYGGERTYVGEKSPTYYNRLPRLAQLFPEAKIIVIWRNPNSIISSIIVAGKTDYFFSNRSLPLRALLGFEKMQSDVLNLRKRGVSIFDFCYEDLVEKPEKWLTSICQFLEIPFDPQMLRLEHADLSMMHPGEHHTKVKSGRLIPSHSLGVLSVDPLQEKIPSYFARWKQIFGDRLATKRYWKESEARPPEAVTIAGDWLWYQLTRFASERFTPFIYGFFPLGPIHRYRNWRRKSFGSAGLSVDETLPATIGSRPLRISVVTPSCKQLPWLKLCIASVADQEGVQVEHIIQDAQSGPELEEWVRTHTHAQLHVECDTGMYDAINRGFARTSGDILCWLNCDEQYLPGTLAKVTDFFMKHPKVDVLFGDALLVDDKGGLLSYRRTVMPHLHHVESPDLNVFSCATFVRRSVLTRGYKLDTRWKAIADTVWIVELLKANIPMAILNEPLSLFTVTNQNLGQTSMAFSETKLWQSEIHPGTIALNPLSIAWHRITKLLNGAYRPRSISTSIYTLSSPQERVRQKK